MELKTTFQNDNSIQNTLQSINEIVSASAMASLAIAKHTNSDKNTALLIGVGTSILVTGLLKYLDD
ncbi:hypothetical protein [Mangrovimonas sp. DI 80]|uniref:hypothetical protein n=1 Tax=Mangrovimonas sp. DI 80 TaxID=1779330 RepID=UPI000976DCFC|nr:hypothetical protein [Mangrovimonas sp. DI 80]OMP32287.1 hypothetical protein BKM32_04340 [Mangrovimonas sp. DI 80]